MFYAIIYSKLATNLNKMSIIIKGNIYSSQQYQTHEMIVIARFTPYDILELNTVSLSLSGGFTPCRHLKPSSGREHTVGCRSL